MARGAGAEEPVRVDARGLTFDLRVAGPVDGATALLLHGFPQHSGMWSGVVPALHEAGLRTVALDQRGYSPGARPPEVADYRVAECVADVVSILDALGVGDAHIVGHDWGAIVGWYLASGHPERVRTLTALSVPHPLAAAAVVAPRDTAEAVDQLTRSAYIRLFREAGHAEEVLLRDDAVRLRRMFTPLPADRVESYVEPLLAPGALSGPLNWYRAMSRADLAALRPVEVPTTYIWGDGDAALGPAAARSCGEYVTGRYRFVELPEVSHWVPDEVPDVVAAEIIALASAVHSG